MNPGAAADGDTASGSDAGTRSRVDVIFVVILLAALALRLHLATSKDYIHDEENTSIPLSKTISFEPGNANLPIRGENHGALPAYVVKASSSLFGTTPLAYRALHLVLGLVAVTLVFLLTRQWYGAVAARWAAALLAFNEYFLAISARATAHVPHLLLAGCGIYAFSRFLRTQRPGYLYAAGLSVGLAFYAKEHSALLLPVFFVTLLHRTYRRWLLSPHVYLACLVFVAVIGVDLYWNLTTDPDTAQVTYSDQVANQATYSSHLRRLGGVGFSPYPAMFYAREPVRSIHLLTTGRELRDETPEYHSVNPVLGMLLVGAVCVTTFAARREPLRFFLLVLFWGIFGFFSLIAKGNPPGRLDPVSWIWVEVTLLATVVLAGARLADSPRRWRAVLWPVAAGALLYAAWTVA